VEKTDSCEVEGFVQYVNVFACSENLLSSDAWEIGINILYVLWSLWLFIALGVSADAFFVPTLTKISNQLKLSDNVAGVTLVAFGNGSPDIFSAIAAFTADDPKVARLAIGSIFGAAMFVQLFVAGSCMLIAPFKTAARPLIRDLVVYLWACYWMFQCLYKGKMELFDAIGLLALYILFVLGVVAGSGSKTLNKLFGTTKFEPPLTEAKNKEEILPPLSPIVKNRARALSNISQVDQKASPKPQKSLGLENPAFNPPASLGLEPQRSRAGTNLSNISNLSRETVTLAPYAKNRARALSRVSQLDVSITSDKISQNLVKTRADYLRQIYIPWDAEEFSEGNFFDKFLCVIISPLYFCMNITCPVVGDDPKESWNYYLSILQGLAMPWAFYLLLMQYGEDPFGSFPRAAIPAIIGVFLAGMIFFFGRNYKDSPPSWYSFFTISSFLTCILWIFTLANEVVAVLTTLGIMWNIDSIIMGLTFLAWANSIGDFVADTSLARIGKARTAIAACFGAPLLNLLFGTSIGAILSITSKPDRDFITLGLDWLELSLTLSVMSTVTLMLFAFPLLGFKANRLLGTIFVILYIGALALCILAGSGLFE